MTKFATSATEFGKKSNHISGAVERKHFITGRIITIYLLYVYVRDEKRYVRESFFFRGNSSLFYVVFVPSRARYKNNIKKTRIPEEKKDF